METQHPDFGSSKSATCFRISVNEPLGARDVILDLEYRLLVLSEDRDDILRGGLGLVGPLSSNFVA